MRAQMNLLRTRLGSDVRVLGALLLTASLVGVAGCDKQPAGPAVSASNTGTVVARVLTDRNAGSTANFQPGIASGGRAVQVGIYRPGETNPLRVVTADATTGKVIFGGLEPGIYTIKPLLRDSSTFASVSPIQVLATAGVTDSSTRFFVRLGGRVTGFLAAQWYDQNRLNTERFEGVTVTLYKESTAGVFDVAIGSAVTDAAGAFDISVKPTTAKLQLRFQLPNQGATGDTLRLAAVNPPATGTPALGSVNVPATTENSPVTFTINGVGSNQDVTINSSGTTIQTFTFQYPSLITGTAFRDLNNNGVKDGTSENLQVGDTVVVQLKNADGTRVIDTRRIAMTSATSAQTYTFASLQAGTYQIGVDLLQSKFAALSPAPVFAPTGLSATLATSSSTATVNVPVSLVPYASTAVSTR